MLLIDPRGRVNGLTERKRALRVSSLDRAVIGLVDNSKPNFQEFLNEISRLLRALHPGVEFVRTRKPNAAIPTLPADKELVTARCHAVITGMGD